MCILRTAPTSVGVRSRSRTRRRRKPPLFSSINSTSGHVAFAPGSSHDRRGPRIPPMNRLGGIRLTVRPTLASVRLGGSVCRGSFRHAGPLQDRRKQIDTGSDGSTQGRPYRPCSPRGDRSAGRLVGLCARSPARWRQRIGVRAALPGGSVRDQSRRLVLGRRTGGCDSGCDLQQRSRRRVMDRGRCSVRCEVRQLTATLRVYSRTLAQASWQSPVGTRLDLGAHPSHARQNHRP
jgi:hypothetical protein